MRSSEPVVLVVEDETLILMTVAEALAEQGFRVLTAATAEDASAILASHDVDLLFTDIDLGGLVNGPALARAARARDPEIRVIYASGRYPFRSPEEMLPGSRYIAKPYRPSAVCSQVAGLLAEGAIAAA